MSEARPPSWSLDKRTFQSLLDRLDPDRERAATRYERLHDRLARFFAWEGCSDPEEPCDETLNRIARKLSQEAQSLDTYLFGLAKLVLLEDRRRRHRGEKALRMLSRDAQPDHPAEPPDQRPAACLRHGLDKLPVESRSLILRYYRGERSRRIANRKNQARELGIPLNALRKQALRMRKRLEDCVRRCLREPGPDPSKRDLKIETPYE